MANKEPEKWITIKGRHIPLYEGETVKDAINRMKSGKKKGPEVKKESKKKEVDKTSKEYRTNQIKKAFDYAKSKIDKESYSWKETVMDAQYEYDIPDKDVSHLEKAMQIYAIKQNKFKEYHEKWDNKFREQGISVDNYINKSNKLEKVHEASDLLKDYKGYETPKKLQDMEKYLKENREQYEVNTKDWLDKRKKLDAARDKYVDKDMVESLGRAQARLLVTDSEHPEIMEIKEKADKQFADIKEYEKTRDEYYDEIEKLDVTQSKKERAEYEKPEFKKAVGEYTGFKTDDTGTSYYNDLIKEDKANIVEMTPEQYIKECAYYVFEDSTWEKVLRGRVGDEDTEKYAKMMREGTKFNTPYLNYQDYGQEGLHRAVAAYINGIKKIPVVIIGKRR